MAAPHGSSVMFWPPPDGSSVVSWLLTMAHQWCPGSSIWLISGVLALPYGSSVVSWLLPMAHQWCPGSSHGPSVVSWPSLWLISALLAPPNGSSVVSWLLLMSHQWCPGSSQWLISAAQNNKHLPRRPNFLVNCIVMTWHFVSLKL